MYDLKFAFKAHYYAAIYTYKRHNFKTMPRMSELNHQDSHSWHDLYYTMIQEKIQSLLGGVSSLTASDAQGLEELRIKYLSKKGVVNDLMNEFRNVPADQKREIGMKLNELKTALQNKFN